MTKDKIMRIALPVMLHSEKEIEAYQVAKDRIEKAMSEKEVPVEVGIFN